LHDAEAVDPEVPDTQLTSDFNGILEGLRDSFPRDVAFKSLNVGKGSCKRLGFAPTMAEADILRHLVFRFI
jgi:hypothetical protein